MAAAWGRGALGEGQSEVSSCSLQPDPDTRVELHTQETGLLVLWQKSSACLARRTSMCVTRRPGVNPRSHSSVPGLGSLWDTSAHTAFPTTFQFPDLPQIHPQFEIGTGSVRSSGTRALSRKEATPPCSSWQAGPRQLCWVLLQRGENQRTECSLQSARGSRAPRDAPLRVHMTSGALSYITGAGAKPEPRSRGPFGPVWG